MCQGGLPLGRQRSDVYARGDGGGVDHDDDHDDAHGDVHHASSVHWQSIGKAIRRR